LPDLVVAPYERFEAFRKVVDRLGGFQRRELCLLLRLVFECLEVELEDLAITLSVL